MATVLLAALCLCRIGTAWSFSAPAATPSRASAIPRRTQLRLLDDDDGGDGIDISRRSALATAAGALLAPAAASATMTSDSDWPLWTALPVAPYSRRRTIRYEVDPGRVWAFDQLIGIYYVHVPIRMSVVAVRQDDEERRGLLVYAPVAPTRECLGLMQELIEKYGPVRDIILPSVSVGVATEMSTPRKVSRFSHHRSSIDTY